MKLSTPFLAFIQATGLVIYVALIALLMVNGQRWFGNIHSILGPILFLLLFIISAIISGLLVLGKAGYLFWERKYKPAFTLLGWTLGFCILYFTAVLSLILFLR